MIGQFNFEKKPSTLEHHLNTIAASVKSAADNLKNALASVRFAGFSKFRMESRSAFESRHTLEENTSKAKRSEFARVYSVQKTAAPLARNHVFHSAVENIDECLVKITRKATRPSLDLAVSSVWPKKNTLAKKR